MSFIKYRVREVAADFGMTPKEVSEVAGKYFDKPKSNSQVLTDEQLNVIFDHITQNRQIDSLEQVFAAAKKPEPKGLDTWDCPNCGKKGITGKFCGECGAKRPEAPKAWDCPNCGTRGITVKFCPECGTKRPEAPKAWDCPECGTKGITAKFCPECGHKRGE